MLALLIAAALAATPAATGERIVHAPGRTGPLEGALLAPASADAPVVVIQPGSGPVDRDGNMPGMRPATYRLLAEALAARGIATVRVDKAGLYGSAGAVADANAHGIDGYAADLHAWAAFLRERAPGGCVWLLGHSEGGLAALVAAQRPDAICGLILVAAPGRRLGDVLRDQLRANPANAPLLPEALADIDALEAGRRVDGATMHPALAALFRPAVQGMLIAEMRLDPAALIAAYKGPVLIVQGARDLQVGVGDARRLAAADPAARLVVVPGANHVLKAVAGDDRAANLATYADPSAPLAPGIADAIAAVVAAPRR